MHKYFYLIFLIAIAMGVFLEINVLAMLGLTVFVFAWVLHLFPMERPLSKDEVEVMKRNGDTVNCARDEGWLIGFGFQDQNPNHQMLL